MRGIGPIVLAAILSLSNQIYADEFADKIKLCTSCHGENGLPVDPNIPIIAGQEFYYLYVQLKDYKSGLRSNPVMSLIVQTLTKDQLRELAHYFSEEKWAYTGYRTPDEVEHEAQRGLVAGQCVQCHLGGYEGNSRIPRLAGQQKNYLERTMLEFKNKVRLNSPAKGSLLKNELDSRIAAMAAYLSGL